MTPTAFSPLPSAAWRRQAYAGRLAAFGVVALMSAGCVSTPTLQSTTFAIPAAEGDICHDRGRRQFYEASNAAIAADDRRRALEGASDLANSPLGQLLIGYVGGQAPMGGTSVRAALSLLDALRQHATEDSMLIRDVGARFEDTARCRQAEMGRIRADLRARRLSRTAAREQAAKLRSEASADVLVAREVNQRLAARSARYLVAAREIDTSLPAGDPNLAARRAETAAVRDTVQTNQRALVAQATVIARSDNARLFDTSGLIRPGQFA